MPTRCDAGDLIVKAIRARDSLRSIMWVAVRGTAFSPKFHLSAQALGVSRAIGRGHQVETAVSIMAGSRWDVTDTHEPVLIGRRGKEPVALIAADDLSAWMETNYLLRSPANARRLKEAIARADAGEGDPLQVDDLRTRLGLTEE